MIINKWNTMDDMLNDLPHNLTIVDNCIKAYSKINSILYNKINCSVSGGSDSDIMLDICYRCDKDNKINYVWFDTGLEYQATKDHLNYIEDKYGIQIIRYKASKPIPITCRDYGQPFLSKMISEYISRLQKHEFNFIDLPYEDLIKLYPNCSSALRWWCSEKGNQSHFNIKRRMWLKEFMLLNPPTFKISAKCCDFAKKNPAHKFLSDGNYDLNIVGIRRYEGGNRGEAYTNCFSEYSDKADEYRPLFYYTNDDKICYDNHFNIEHSNCYSEYGLKRTGCAGCPFGKYFQDEVDIIKTYEPKLYKAVNSIFKDSYEYTIEYKKFCEEMNEKYGSYSSYLRNKNNL